jgi:hypothetical protein
MHRNLPIALLALSLGACGTPMVWYKDTSTLAMANQDSAQCEYEATVGAAASVSGMTPGTAAGVFEGTRKAELHALCLKARGYRLVPKT